MTQTAKAAAIIAGIASTAFAVTSAYAETLGEDVVPWDSAPDYVTESVINGVEFLIENPEAGPAENHDNWRAFKLAAGWELGEKKDGRKKEHPLLVEFDALPPEQAFKNVLFVQVVRGILGAVDMVPAPGVDPERLEFLENIGERVRDAVLALISAVAPDMEIAPKSDEDVAEHGARLLTELLERVSAAEEANGNSDESETIAALEDQVRSLTEDLAKAKAEAAKAARATSAQIRKGARPSKIRKVGPIKGGTDTEAVIAAMEGPDPVQVVLSDGGHEIMEFDPIDVGGGGFYRRGKGRFDLIEALLVQGAGQERRVRGVGLFAGGKQIAWTEFPNVVTVPVGQQVKFDRMISF